MTEDDNDEIEFDGVSINKKTMRGTGRNGDEFEVSQREIDLLEYFIKHEGEVLDRNKIMMAIWGSNYRGFSRTLDQHIVQLRKKIESDHKDPKIIQTVYGIGYRFGATGGATGRRRK
jgi:DNA-binding response OmpR family regulator